MSSKTVWITVLNKSRNEAAAKALYQTVSAYGLSVAGHFWEDLLEKLAWAGPREDLTRRETALWIILGSAEDLAVGTVRYGLSLLAAGVHSMKGYGFPILIAVTEGELAAESLPTQLKGADVLAAGAASLGAKIAAKANLPLKKIEPEYRLDVHGLEGVGQWFEVGPPPGRSWSGVMFGVSSGEINAHGVGSAHKLPERSVLEYPMQGLKLQLGEVEYTAWAVQNTLTDVDSYYLRVNDYPASVLFGPLAQGDDAEVFVVALK